MNHSEYTSIDRFLINYFSGEATTEEEIFVQQWVSGAPENTDYFQKIKKLWIQRILL